MVERPLIAQQVIGSIPHRGPTDLFYVPASVPLLV